MPTLKVKTVYIEKLKSLGVYDAWLDNVKAQNPNDERLETTYNSANFNQFINNSFSWGKTPEGYAYWWNIYDKK